jgi:hypothetical protein
MNIKIYDWSDDDWTNFNVLSIDGKELTLQDLSESPEDATLGRRLVSAHDIVKYMQMAYNAGLAKEDLNIELIEEPPEDFY